MKLPDRWLDYKPVGEVITGTRFICFKVPLRIVSFCNHAFSILFIFFIENLDKIQLTVSHIFALSNLNLCIFNIHYGLGQSENKLKKPLLQHLKDKI